MGVRHLAYNDGGFRYFTNDERPIKTMADLEGLKIRVAMESEVMIDTVNAFGASAVPMSFGELIPRLQQGVVDGQENPMNLIYSRASTRYRNTCSSVATSTIHGSSLRLNAGGKA